jgi:hypothetical protein
VRFRARGVRGGGARAAASGQRVLEGERLAVALPPAFKACSSWRLCERTGARGGRTAAAVADAGRSRSAGTVRGAGRRGRGVCATTAAVLRKTDGPRAGVSRADRYGERVVYAHGK